MLSQTPSLRFLLRQARGCCPVHCFHDGRDRRCARTVHSEGPGRPKLHLTRPDKGRKHPFSDFVFNVPNTITVSRIVATPYLAWLITQESFDLAVYGACFGQTLKYAH